MTRTFFIIDHDTDSCKTLEMLIHKHHLGRVVCTLHSGENAVSEILFYQPNVVIIAQALPDADSIAVTRRISSAGFLGKIILTACTSDDDRRTEAYESGIAFYLTKPFNHAEAVRILQMTAELIDLTTAMNTIKTTIFTLSDPLQPQHISVQNQISHIFYDIGLAGLAGTDDIQAVLLKILSHRRISNEPYQLKEIYRSICLDQGKSDAASQRALEQRIRRTIQKALSFLAQIGCTDYYDSLFTEYASLLFDLRQVQQEMKHIRNPREKQGKINTKKFLSGILSHITI